MNQMLAFDRRDIGVRAARVAHADPGRIADDMAMLRTAAELTRDLNAPKPAVYWADLLVSCAIGYSAMATAMLVASPAVALVAAVIAILALYRAGSFIHELTHIKHASVPGFRLGWNLIIGIPMLVPSFLYEGVHSLHHARTRYGTADDPEYLPLARMKPHSVPLFVFVSLLAPVLLFVRFAVMTPLSLVIPGFRNVVEARYSAMATNPVFQRRAPEGELKKQWYWQEAGASLWSISMLTLVATGVIPLREFAIFLGIGSGIAVLNQVRTLVAHLWENEGEAITVTAQYLDSVNVPPPALLPLIWAPVGLRFHALHHLLPGLPYHALAEAHRRLSSVLEPSSPFHRADYAGLPVLLSRLIDSTMRVGRRY